MFIASLWRLMAIWLLFISAEKGKPDAKRLEEIDLIRDIILYLSSKPKSRKRTHENRAEIRCRLLLPKYLERDKSVSVRLRALTILFELGIRAYGPLLVKVAYTDNSDKVRVAAVRALANLNYSQALPCFHCWIGNDTRRQPSAALRVAVINALATLGDETSLEELQSVSYNKKATVNEKKAAETALSALHARLRLAEVKAAEQTRRGRAARGRPYKWVGGLGHSTAEQARRGRIEVRRRRKWVDDILTPVGGAHAIPIGAGGGEMPLKGKPSGADNGRVCAHHIQTNDANNRRAGVNPGGVVPVQNLARRLATVQ
ncbi:TPA: HEAT repeat domain-containing protein [Candidatus Micrarchaeota archaeon]|nr:HEAT repeat domain-containing protein [Candidatus Micrarchaeota archaeon]